VGTKNSIDELEQALEAKRADLVDSQDWEASAEPSRCSFSDLQLRADGSKVFTL
jgi:hypothetical protein